MALLGAGRARTTSVDWATPTTSLHLRVVLPRAGDLQRHLAAQDFPTRPHLVWVLPDPVDVRLLERRPTDGSGA